MEHSARFAEPPGDTTRMTGVLGGRREFTRVVLHARRGQRELSRERRSGDVRLPGSRGVGCGNPPALRLSLLPSLSLSLTLVHTPRTFSLAHALSVSSFSPSRSLARSLCLARVDPLFSLSRSPLRGTREKLSLLLPPPLLLLMKMVMMMMVVLLLLLRRTE